MCTIDHEKDFGQKRRNQKREEDKCRRDYYLKSLIEEKKREEKRTWRREKTKQRKAKQNKRKGKQIMQAKGTAQYNVVQCNPVVQFSECSAAQHMQHVHSTVKQNVK